MCGICLVICDCSSNIDFEWKFIKNKKEDEEDQERIDFWNRIESRSLEWKKLTNLNKTSNIFKREDCLEALKRRGPDHLGCLKIDLNGNNNINNHKFELELISSVLSLRGDKLTEQPIVDSDGNILMWNGEIFGGNSIDLSKELSNPHWNDGLALSSKLHEKFSATSSKQESKDEAQVIESIFHNVEGPYGFVYWRKSTKTFYFGRSWMGQRSMLIHLPNDRFQSFSISSVPFKNFHIEQQTTPTTAEQPKEENQKEESTKNSSTNNNNNNNNNNIKETKDNNGGEDEGESQVLESDWLELPTGLISCQIIEEGSGKLSLHFRDHGWKGFDSNSRKYLPFGFRKDGQASQKVGEKELSEWNPNPALDRLLSVLGEAVRVRVQCIARVRQSLIENGKLEINNNNHHTISTTSTSTSTKQQESLVAVLFSGGIDSLVVAALADRFVPAEEPIDLLNVAFGKEKEVGSGKFNFEVSDRLSGREALKELREKVNPKRKWNFVEIDVSPDELKNQRQHIWRLIYPRCTIMDLTIGAALWFASRGEGGVRDPSTVSAENPLGKLSSYKSGARVLLSGLGADEQLAGYGRHRSAFSRWGGWERLEEELRKDVGRLWQRNLGRDDRVMSDNAKELRFPFLDENVMRLLCSEFSIWNLCRLTLAPGKGDKWLLRQLAIQRIGISDKVASFTKRAIQFGSQSAKQLFPHGKQNGATFLSQ